MRLHPVRRLDHRYHDLEDHDRGLEFDLVTLDRRRMLSRLACERSAPASSWTAGVSRPSILPPLTLLWDRPPYWGLARGSRGSGAV